jgi:hypothetical protein
LAWQDLEATGPFETFSFLFLKEQLKGIIIIMAQGIHGA